jgi:hypothetical protein
VDEMLVLLGPGASMTARDLAAKEPVAGGAPQLFGGRVLIARLTTEDSAAVSAMDGVSGVYAGAVPPDVELPDDFSGRVAVDAWNERQKTAARGGKRRVGDGAAWDDARFEREGDSTPERD